MPSKGRLLKVVVARLCMELFNTLIKTQRSRGRLWISVETVVCIAVLSAFCGGVLFTSRVQRDNTYHDKPMERPDKPMERNDSIIFIGGVPRSGTTLMRVLLDAHPAVRCGQETRIIPKLLAMARQTEADLESKRLHQAGLTRELLDQAFGDFIRTVITEHGPPAPRLCNKDPMALKSALYLKRLFPKSRFIVMIRDGRAVAHSIFTRKVKITGVNIGGYDTILKFWNRCLATMLSQCSSVGGDCLQVRYEELVTNPRPELERILSFLELPWHDNVMHHESFVGQEGGAAISSLELSSNQVKKAVYTNAIDKWKREVPEDVLADALKHAPLLRTLGYV